MTDAATNEPAMEPAAMAEPGPCPHTALIDVDTGTWADLTARVPPWLATTLLLQRTFRHQVAAVARSVEEPHIRRYLTDVAGQARRHERDVDRLYDAFGLPRRHRRATDVVAPLLLAGGRQASAQVMGRVAGAHGGAWRGMRELLRSNLDALSGFAVAEQLGLALGAPAVVDIALPVQQAKKTDQLLLQEYLLEMAPQAVLHRRDA